MTSRKRLLRQPDLRPKSAGPNDEIAPCCSCFCVGFALHWILSPARHPLSRIDLASAQCWFHVASQVLAAAERRATIALTLYPRWADIANECTKTVPIFRSIAEVGRIGDAVPKAERIGDAGRVPIGLLIDGDPDSLCG